ncbi:uncharacterized protein LOC110629917 [Manihot esculenta]|uniref:Maternal effect embryo arrest 59 n=1 Tax=Manihot esculenta TaxID=3983 RepID=A0A2C9UT00_MANES|nr:uncharacterized protein LOC110629917 [Manihot esculenta]OAY33708.1 hypothetical protein MANES_13G117600v8 [Manihot esculenta]
MVGHWTVTKPSRSDEVLDTDQQLQIANQVRAQFDSIAPKRPAKPNRSESESDTTPPKPVPSDADQIPELDRLRSLQSQSSGIFSAEGALVEQDEFVETHYYKELDSIDKQHHTTGSGFIRVVGEENTNGYNIELPRGHGVDSLVSGCRSNPATNDWIPNLVVDDQAFVSSKPNRSEGS